MRWRTLTESCQSYRNYLVALEKRWVGRHVVYGGDTYKVVGVDYNGFLLIDKKAEFTDTTAIDALTACVAE